MATNQPSDRPSAMRDEIMRRKMARVGQELQQRQMAKLQGSAPTGPSAAQSATSTASLNGTPAVTSAKPTTAAPTKSLHDSQPIQVKSGVENKTPARKPFQNLTPRAKITLSLLGVAVMLVVVLAGSLATAANGASDGNAAVQLADLPLSNLDAVMNHLKDVGVPVSGVTPYDLTNTQIWQDAQAAEQFTVQRSGGQGKFILFSYATADKATNDVFDVMTSGKYKNWGIYSFSNIVLLSAPESSAAVKSEMVSHLTQFLFAPYRPFWPTSTPVPTSTPKATASR